MSSARAAGLPRLRQESLAQQAYQELKEAILSGRLAPGTTLAEVDLAERLGISRTPLREALALLRGDGLVDGNTVRALAPDEVRELFLLREALEALAVREYVGRNGRGNDVATLERLIERQRRAVATGDVERFLTADEEFHLTLCRDAGLPQVAQLLASLREKMRQAGLRAVAQPDRMPQVIAEHESILRAVKSGNGERATTAVLRHLRITKDAFEGRQ